MWNLLLSTVASSTNAEPPAPPEAPTYWAVRCKNSANYTYVGIAGLFFRDAANASLSSIGGTPFASEILNDNVSSYGPARAMWSTSGLSRWSANANAFAEGRQPYMGIQFNTPVRPAKVQLYAISGGSFNHSPTEFDVISSVDGVNWTLEASFTTATWGSSGSQTFDIPAA
ncbi:hypothetical protein RPALISO_71 [Ruegeria phage RpAliso]|nr:hypothetical protein RPALISO_71 [Ruegeria phage RpAliso]